MENYVAPWWCKNPHIQTIFAGRIRKPPPVALDYSIFELDDGDVIDLASPTACEPLPDDAPTIVLLHGLEGSATSRYALGMMAAFLQQGWRTIVMHQRGCGPTPNRLPRAYHALETGDLEAVIQHTHSTFPKAKLALLGYSLGGAISLNWLSAKKYDHNRIAAAVVVSVPMLLASAAERVNQGFSKVYQRDFLKGLMLKLEQRRTDYPDLLPELDATQFTDFFSYDDAVTAPLHGFADAQTYYQQASPKAGLKTLQTPTLVIHSEDDPFMTAASTPTTDDVSSAVELAVTKHGGHVAFMHGKPWRPEYWLETAVPNYLGRFLE